MDEAGGRWTGDFYDGSDRKNDIKEIMDDYFDVLAKSRSNPRISDYFKSKMWVEDCAETKDWGEPVKIGDTVTFIKDGTKMEVKVNGVSRGVLYDNLPEGVELFPYWECKDGPKDDEPRRAKMTFV
jgi:hypothetical protein